ncbi:hypothetical protein EG68_01300 [Paragonimus skrjabini miyazakii]|uniref:GAIN-B domain-containing protein n=1 Tax=Paragonimus skrjabini miyazakii TaxID=59628 RepID=A0A8S9Z5S8_9TREM|nr:hypothetical protein EG68_01300 [Paragonimus skrjabini miyazakii]
MSLKLLLSTFTILDSINVTSTEPPPYNESTLNTVVVNESQWIQEFYNDYMEKMNSKMLQYENAIGVEPTNLPSFHDPVVPEVKPEPIHVYEAPTESLQDVRYSATANHWWKFLAEQSSLTILDLAPQENALSRALFTRFQALDPIMFGDNVFPQPNDSRSLFVPLRGAWNNTQSDKGLSTSNSHSVVLQPNDNQSGCLELIQSLQLENAYLRQCLFNAEDCEYGLSISIWMKFLNDSYVNPEVILSTAPQFGHGFAIYIQNARLTFELRTAKRQLLISAPLIKQPHRWTNVAVIWTKDTKHLVLFVDRHVVAEKHDYDGNAYVGNAMSPSSLWIGCSVDSKGVATTTTSGMAISDIVLWYWPLAQLELLTGAMELYLMGEPGKPTNNSGSGSTKSRYEVDYTELVEEYNPWKDNIPIPDNPFYQVADHYESMQTEISQSIPSADVSLIVDSQRNRNAYQIDTNDGFALASRTTVHDQVLLAGPMYMLHTFGASQCPVSISACQEGLSVGVWLLIPSLLVENTQILDIFQLGNAMKLSVCEGQLSVSVYTSGNWLVSRILWKPPFDTWFNLGLSITKQLSLQVQAYVNGAGPLSTYKVLGPPISNQHRSVPTDDSLLIGSALFNCSAVGIALNDLVIWYRSLFEIERHRFIGYARSQLASLEKSTYYWTPDVYILQDSAAQLQAHQFTQSNQIATAAVMETTGYALASLYKPKGIKFRMNSLDHLGKSRVPLVDPKVEHYMFLGRKKTADVTAKAIDWSATCLHDPNTVGCGARGFTLSCWLKLLSTSTTRMRFLLNSGESGIAGPSAGRPRGVSIYTDASLLGVTVTNLNVEWTLTLDPTSYTQGKWINIGVFWREDSGLKVLLDGVDYGMWNKRGKWIYRPELGPPYVVLGRLNTDERETWISPAEAQMKSDGDSHWEMANFVLGELAYFDWLQSENEYREHTGLTGILSMRNYAGYLWQGKELVDAPISQLMAAATNGYAKPGSILLNNPFATIQYLPESAAVELRNGSSLRLGILPTSGCPVDLNDCGDGLTVGGWFRFGNSELFDKSESADPVVILTGVGGSLGIALSQDGDVLAGWVRDITTNGVTWMCSTGSLGFFTGRRKFQWTHLAIVWDGPSSHADSQQSFLRLFVNGLERQKCPPNTTNTEKERRWFDVAMWFATFLYQRTNTNPKPYLLLCSELLEDVQSSLTIKWVTLDTSALTGMQIAKAMGVQQYQLHEWQLASMYWPVDQLAAQLYPQRIQTVNTSYSLNQYGTARGALCTHGTELSYIELRGDNLNKSKHSNLLTSCVVNSTICSTFTLSLVFMLSQLPGPNTGPRELFRSNPMDSPSDVISTQLIISPDGQNLTITVVGEQVQSFSSVSLKELNQPNRWITLDVNLEQNKIISVFKNGMLINEPSETVITQRKSRYLSSVYREKQHLLVGRGLQMCLSSAAVVEDDMTDIHSAEASVATCYIDVGYLAFPNPSDFLQLGLDNFGKLSNQFVPDLVKTPTVPCLYDPDHCSESGISLSIWVNIERIESKARIYNHSTGPHQISAVLFSSGAPLNRGILLEVTSNSDDYGFRCSVRTVDKMWTVSLPNVINVNVWMNLGLTWSFPADRTRGTLAIYLDGVFMKSSSLHQQVLRTSELGNELLFGPAYATAVPTDTERSALLNGSISNFAFWSSIVASCSSPQQTHARLRGECEVNVSIPATATCMKLDECTEALGDVCLDPTAENLCHMTAQLDRIINSDSYEQLLLLATSLINNSLMQTATEIDRDQMKSVLSSTIEIFTRWLGRLEQRFSTTNYTECPRIVQEAKRYLQLTVRLTDLLTNPQLTPTWTVLQRWDHKKLANRLITSVDKLLSMIALAKVQSSVCVGEVKVFTNQSVMILAVKETMTSIEPHGWTIRSELTQYDGSEKTSYFTLDGEDFQTTRWKVTLFGLSQRSPMDTVTAGDLPTDRFVPTALNGHPPEQNGNHVTDIVRLAHSTKWNVSSLYINSPIHSLHLYNCSETCAEFVNHREILIRFTVPLSIPNQLHDIVSYEHTGLKKWRAEQAQIDLTRAHSTGGWPLEHPVRCVFWNETVRMNKQITGAWDATGCRAIWANTTHVQCECRHFSVFAIAMESSLNSVWNRTVWETWGVHSLQIHEDIQKYILFGANALSLACAAIVLGLLLVRINQCGYADGYILRCGLMFSLMLFHAALLLQPIFQCSYTGCRAIGMVVNASTLTAAGFLSCHAIWLLYSFLNGIRFPKCQSLLCFLAFLIPALQIGIPAAYHNQDHHGEGLLCLPSKNSYAFLMMCTTLVVNYLVTVLTRLLYDCNFETPAYQRPEFIEQLCDQFDALLGTAVFLISSWAALALTIYYPIKYLGYIAYAAVSMQGAVIGLAIAITGLDKNSVLFRRINKPNQSHWKYVLSLPALNRAKLD